MSAEESDTRALILNVSAEQIRVNGFRATGLNDILSKTGLTKGAFYHYFKSKAELGKAVALEVVDAIIKDMWIAPLKRYDKAIDAIKATTDFALAAMTPQAAIDGCPLVNLALEMAPHDSDIRDALKQTVADWVGSIEEALFRDQGRGLIDPSINCQDAATFIVANLQGAIGLTKSTQDPAVFRSCLRVLDSYLDTLRVKN